MPAKRSGEIVSGTSIISPAMNAEAGPSTPRQTAHQTKPSSSARAANAGIKRVKHRPTVVYQLDGSQKSYETKLSRTAEFDEALSKAGKKLGLASGVRLAHVREGGREVDILDQFDYDAFRSRAFALRAASPVVIKVYTLAPPPAPPAAPSRLPGATDARSSALAFIRQEALSPASSSPTSGAGVTQTTPPVKAEKSKKAKKRRSSTGVTGEHVPASLAEPVIGHKRRRSPSPSDHAGSAPMSTAASAPLGSTSPPKNKRKKARKSELVPLLTSSALPVRPGLAQRLSAVERYRPAVSSPLSRAIQASPLLAPTAQGVEDVAAISPIGVPDTSDSARPVTPPPPTATGSTSGLASSAKARKPRKGRKSVISLPPDSQPIYGGIASSPTYRREGYSSSSIDSPPRAKAPPAAREIVSTPGFSTDTPDTAPVAAPTPLVTPGAGPSRLPTTTDKTPRPVKPSRRTSSAKRANSVRPTASPAPGVRAPVAAGFLRQIVDDIFASYQQKKEVKGTEATPSSPGPSSSEVSAPALAPSPVPAQVVQAGDPDEAVQHGDVENQDTATEVPASQPGEHIVTSGSGPDIEQASPTAPEAISPAADPEPVSAPSDEGSLDKSGRQASTNELPNSVSAPEATTLRPQQTSDIVMLSEPDQPATAEERTQTVAPQASPPVATPEEPTAGLAPAPERSMIIVDEPEAARPAKPKGKTATPSSFAPLSVRERRGRPSRAPCLICQNGQHLQAECPTVKAGLPAIREALEVRRATDKKDRDTDLAIEALEAWVTRLETISRKIRGEPPLPAADAATPAAADRTNGSQPVAPVTSPVKPAVELVNRTAAEVPPSVAKQGAAASPAVSEPPLSVQIVAPPTTDTQTPIRKNRLVQPVVPDTNSRMPEIYRIAQSKSGSVSGMSASSALIESGSSDSGSSVTDSDSDSDSDDDSDSEDDGSGSASESGSSEGDVLSDQEISDAGVDEETGADADSEDEEGAIAEGRIGVPVQTASDVGDDGVEADDELDEEDNRDVEMAEPLSAPPTANSITAVQARVPSPTINRTPKQAGAVPLASADNETDESATTDSDTIDTATSVTTSRSPSPDRSRSPSMSGRSSAGSPVRYEDPHELMQRIMSQTLSRKDQRRARQSAVGMQDVVLSDAEGSNASDGESESTVRRGASSDNDDDGSDHTPIKQPPPTQRRVRSASMSSIGDFEDGAAGLAAGFDADGDVDMRDAEMDEILPSSMMHPPAFASANESIVEETPIEPAGTPPPVVPSSQSEYTPRTFRQLQRDAGTSPIIGDLDGSKAFEEARAEESTPSAGASMSLPDTQMSSQRPSVMVPTQSTAQASASETDVQPTKRMTRQTSRASAAPETVPEAEPQTPRPANISQRQLRRQTSAIPHVEVTPRMRTRRSVSQDPSSVPPAMNSHSTGPNGLGLGLGLALEDQAGGDAASVTPKVTTYRTRRQAMLPSSQVDELESSQLVPPVLPSSGVPVNTTAAANASTVEDGDNNTDLFHTPPHTVGPEVNSRLSRRSGQDTQAGTPVGAGPKTRRASAASTARSSVPPSPVQLRRSSRRTASVSLEPPSPVMSKTPLAAARSPRASKASSQVAMSQMAEEQTPRQRRTPLFMEASQMPQTQAYNLLPSSMLDTQEQASATRRLNGLKSSSKASFRETSPIPEEEGDGEREREQSYHSPEKQLSLQDVIPDTQPESIPNGQGSPHAAVNGENGDNDGGGSDDDARSEISEATASVAPSESDVEPDSPVLTPRPQIRPRTSLGASQPAFSYPTLSSLSQSALRLGTSAYDRVTGRSSLGGRMSASQPVIGQSGLANGGAAHSRNGSAAGGRASTILGTENEDDGTTTDDSGSSSEDEAVPSARATAARAAAGGAQASRPSTGVNGSKAKVNGALKGRYAGEQKKKKTYGQVKGW